MKKRLVAGVALSLFALSLLPATGMAWHHRPRPYYSHHHYHGHSDDWVWGLTGLLIGGALVAAATRPVVYAAPPPVVAYPPYSAYGPPAQARVYSYPPAVPPGLCRWERYVLDGQGRALLDAYGQPIREYTIGSCEYPPY
jgi:hypothetical protein